VPDLETSEVNQVYTRDAIIPSGEWSSIDLQHLYSAEDDKGRMGALPYRRSGWIRDKVRVTLEGPSGVRKTNL
jgi:DNA-directed RNA polymerase I subunit RPA49